AAIHHFGELRIFALALDGPRGHVEPGGQLLVGTLKAAELLQFGQVNLRCCSSFRHCQVCLLTADAPCANRAARGKTRRPRGPRRAGSLRALGSVPHSAPTRSCPRRSCATTSN